MLTPHQDQHGSNGSHGPQPGLADVWELGDEVAVVSMGDLSRGDAGKPVFSPSRSGVLRQEVTLAIEKAILLGAIAPGQRLVESDVANQMGISKAPVREAL